MISIKDYAKNKGVSYEAVRKQVNRYKDELTGHIHKQNRTQYLDDEAVAFLDSKRAESPVILLQMDKDEEIQRLSDENKMLLIKVAELQDKLLQANDKVQLLQEEKIALLEAQNEIAMDKDTEKKPWWKFW